jgi:hypothetical protein
LHVLRKKNKTVHCSNLLYPVFGGRLSKWGYVGYYIVQHNKYRSQSWLDRFCSYCSIIAIHKSFGEEHTPVAVGYLSQTHPRCQYGRRRTNHGEAHCYYRYLLLSIFSLLYKHLTLPRGWNHWCLDSLLPHPTPRL